MVSRLTAFAAAVLLFAGLMLALGPHAAAQDRGRSQPGDLNYNGRVDFYDIEPFVVALFDPAEWRSRYNRSQRELLDVADFDANGTVDRGDIHGFGKAMVRAGGGGQDGAGAGGGGVIAGTGSVDLDVDSDNNDGTNLPGRTEPEDLIEDDPNETGKFVLVNDDDDDRNGTPDKDQDGTIDAEADDLVPLVLEITPASNVQPFEFLDYRLVYPANVRLWRLPVRGNLAADVVVSGATQTQQVWILGDMNGDGVLNAFDIEPFLLALFDPDEYAIQFPGIDGVAVGDMNGDGALDSFDIEAFTDALFSGITSYVPVRMWIEGLIPSATKADTRFVAESDTDKNGSFESDDAVRTTIFSLTASATSGPVGTAVTWTLDPAIAPVAFDASTTAQWDGVYQPLVGPPTSAFSASYSAAQVRESSSTQAILVVGDGALTNAPDPTDLDGGGTLVGDQSFQFGSIPVKRAFDFALDTGAAVWEMVSYPGDGLGPPTLDGEPAELTIFMLSETPDPANPEEALLFRLYDYHYAPVVRIEENPTSLAEAPASLLVDLIAVDQSNMEFNRLEDVVLLRDDADGDPSFITYKNDLTVPLILVDSPLDPQNFTDIIPFHVVPGGAATIVPAGSG